MPKIQAGSPTLKEGAVTWIRRWWLGLVGLLLAIGSIPVCLIILRANAGRADFGWFEYQPLPLNMWYVNPESLLLALLISLVGLLLTVGVVGYRIGAGRARRNTALRLRNDEIQG